MTRPRIPNRKPVIGLTGGIGSGKSLVARQLESLGCGVIDSDAIAHRVIDETEVRTKLVAVWGESVIAADGRVDRKAVGRIVFNDAGARQKLESVIHPLIHRERARLRDAFERDATIVAIIEDAPLLFEVGLDAECDAVIFVDAPREARLRRVADTRGWTADELDRRERTQMPLDTKAQRADYVVVNDAGQADCLVHVRRVLSQILSSQRG